MPLTLIRRPIQNRFLRSFLFYVPYVTLAVMTFPAIIQATQSRAAGLAAMAVCVFTAWRGASLIKVAAAGCAAALLVELLLPGI